MESSGATSSPVEKKEIDMVSMFVLISEHILYGMKLEFFPAKPIEIKAQYVSLWDTH